MPRLAAVLVLGALALASWLLWGLGGHDLRPRAVQRSPVVEGARVEPGLELGEPAVKRSEALPGEQEHIALAPASRQCPDLEVLLAELAQQITSGRLSVEAEWNPACRALAGELDEHCRRALSMAGAEPERGTEPRLAAWSLLAASAGEVPGDELDDGSRALLWVCAEPRRPVSLEYTLRADGGSSERVLRDQVARLAAQCMAVLGSRDDRIRLAAWLTQPDVDQVARFGLTSAREGDALEPVLAALESSEGSAMQAALLLASWMDRGVAELNPVERERAALAAEQAWDAPDGSSKSPYHLLLSRLDADRCAAGWIRRLDSGDAQQGAISHAVRALMLRSDRDDLDRVETLLASTQGEVRIAAASQVLFQGQEGRAPPALVAGAQASLIEVVRTSPTPALRCLALRNLGPRPAGASVHPELRAVLEAAATADSDATVRLEARRILERSDAPSRLQAGSEPPSGN